MKGEWVFEFENVVESQTIMHVTKGLKSIFASEWEINTAVRDEYHLHSVQ